MYIYKIMLEKSARLLVHEPFTGQPHMSDQTETVWNIISNEETRVGF